MTLRLRMRAPALCLLFESIAACSGSKEDQARKLEQEKASWNATVQLTRELSDRGALTGTYTRQVLRKADQKLEQIRQQQSRLAQ